MLGLEHWYTEMFEKLDWMVLAKSRVMTDKINTYKKSLQRLKMAIEQKHEKIQNKVHKDDLMIMLDNMKFLFIMRKKIFEDNK